MIYRSWDIEQNVLKLVILGHFLPLTPVKTPKIKTFKNEKICWRYHHFINVYQTSQYMMYSSWDTEWDTEFLVILGHFLPLYHAHSPHNDPENQIFEEKKKIKNAWRYYPFIHICVPSMKIIWYTVPEMQGMTDWKCRHFRPLFALSAPWQPGKSKF